MNTKSHQLRDWCQAKLTGSVRIEPDAAFRCRCAEPDPCAQRATQEDQLCDWCRASHPGSPQEAARFGTEAPGGVEMRYADSALTITQDGLELMPPTKP